jgi:hypothetical protein
VRAEEGVGRDVEAHGPKELQAQLFIGLEHAIAGTSCKEARHVLAPRGLHELPMAQKLRAKGNKHGGGLGLHVIVARGSDMQLTVEHGVAQSVLRVSHGHVEERG